MYRVVEEGSDTFRISDTQSDKCKDTHLGCKLFLIEWLLIWFVKELVVSFDEMGEKLSRKSHQNPQTSSFLSSPNSLSFNDERKSSNRCMEILRSIER